MTKVAIPIFQNRVSPVLDSCKHMLLIDIENGAEQDRETVFLGDMSLGERCRVFTKMGVTLVICGGVSELLANVLKGSQIDLANGIAGDVDEVIRALLQDRLYLPEFYMPGFKPNI